MIRLRIKEIAEEQDISQGKLARKADVDPKAMNTIFRDPYTNITLKTLDKIARALGVSAKDLIEDEE